MIEVGMTFSLETTVTENDTAKSFGSGGLEVLATPKMISLMEEASYKCVQSSLEEGSSTVGTSVNIKHVSATAKGVNVKVESTVVAVDGRKIEFCVKAYDEYGLIGEGTHERFVINSEKFLSKVYAKTK